MMVPPARRSTTLLLLLTAAVACGAATAVSDGKIPIPDDLNQAACPDWVADWEAKVKGKQLQDPKGALARLFTGLAQYFRSDAFTKPDTTCERGNTLKCGTVDQVKIVPGPNVVEGNNKALSLYIGFTHFLYAFQALCRARDICLQHRHQECLQFLQTKNANQAFELLGKAVASIETGANMRSSAIFGADKATQLDAAESMLSEKLSSYAGDIIVVWDAGSSKSNIEMFNLAYKQHAPQLGGVVELLEMEEHAEPDGEKKDEFRPIPDKIKEWRSGARSVAETLAKKKEDGCDSVNCFDPQPPFEIPQLFHEGDNGMYFNPGVTSFVDGDEKCPTKLNDVDAFESKLQKGWKLERQKNGPISLALTAKPTCKAKSDCKGKIYTKTGLEMKSLFSDVKSKVGKDPTLMAACELATTVGGGSDKCAKDPDLLQTVWCDTCSPSKFEDDMQLCSWPKCPEKIKVWDCLANEPPGTMCDKTTGAKAPRQGSVARMVAQAQVKACVSVTIPAHDTWKPVVQYFGLQKKAPLAFWNVEKVQQSVDNRMHFNGFVELAVNVLKHKTKKVQTNKRWAKSGLRTFLVVRATAGMRKAVPTAQVSSANMWRTFDRLLKKSECNPSDNCESVGNKKEACETCMLFTDKLKALTEDPTAPKIPTVRIIPGPEEAFRGWITAKYLHVLYKNLVLKAGAEKAGHKDTVQFQRRRYPWVTQATMSDTVQYSFERDPFETPCFFEMGGSSVQVSYMVPKQFDRTKRNPDFIVPHTEFRDQNFDAKLAADPSKGPKYEQDRKSDELVNLYQRSFLYAGGEDAKKLYIQYVKKFNKDKRGACFPAVMAMKLPMGGPDDVSPLAHMADLKPAAENAPTQGAFAQKSTTIAMDYKVNRLALNVQAERMEKCEAVLAAAIKNNPTLKGKSKALKGQELQDWKSLTVSSAECFVPTLDGETVELNYAIAQAATDKELEDRFQQCMDEIGETWSTEPKQFMEDGKCPNLLFRRNDKGERERVVGHYCLKRMEGTPDGDTAADEIDNCRVFSGGLERGEDEIFNFPPTSKDDFPMNSRVNGGLPVNEEVNGEKVPVWSSYPLDYGEECDVSQFHWRDRCPLTPEDADLSEPPAAGAPRSGAAQRDIIMAGSGFYMTLMTNLEILSLHFWFRQCVHKKPTEEAQVAKCANLNRLVHCGGSYNLERFRKVVPDYDEAEVKTLLGTSVFTEDLGKTIKDLDAKLGEGYKITEAMEKFEQDRIDLMLCPEGFKMVEETGECEKDTDGTNKGDYGGGMCKAGAKYNRPPLALHVKTIHALAHLFCGKHSNQLYSAALLMRLGKPPEAVCLMTSYVTFLVHNLVGGFHHGDGSTPAHKQWVSAKAIENNDRAVLFMMGVVGAPQPGAKFVPMAWVMGSSLIEMAPVALSRAKEIPEATKDGKKYDGQKLLAMPKKMYVQVESLLDPDSKDAEREAESGEIIMKTTNKNFLAEMPGKVSSLVATYTEFAKKQGELAGDIKAKIQQDDHDLQVRHKLQQILPHLQKQVDGTLDTSTLDEATAGVVDALMESIRTFFPKMQEDSKNCKIIYPAGDESLDVEKYDAATPQQQRTDWYCDGRNPRTYLSESSALNDQSAAVKEDSPSTKAPEENVPPSDPTITVAECEQEKERQRENCMPTEETLSERCKVRVDEAVRECGDLAAGVKKDLAQCDKDREQWKEEAAKKGNPSAEVRLELDEDIPRAECDKKIEEAVREAKQAPGSEGEPKQASGSEGEPSACKSCVSSGRVWCNDGAGKCVERGAKEPADQCEKAAAAVVKEANCEDGEEFDVDETDDDFWDPNAAQDYATTAKPTPFWGSALKEMNRQDPLVRLRKSINRGFATVTDSGVSRGRKFRQAALAALTVLKSKNSGLASELGGMVNRFEAESISSMSSADVSIPEQPGSDYSRDEGHVELHEYDSEPIEATRADNIPDEASARMPDADNAQVVHPRGSKAATPRGLRNQ